MLFDSYALGKTQLANRTIMAPMTRSRAVEANTPNALMAEYYGQRATAGLIITEGVSPSPDGLGYTRIPGLFNAQHVAGWRLVTDAVHAKGGKIFAQIMHCGRVGNQLNLPVGARVVSPTADTLPGEIWTDASGMQPHTAPHALTEAEIPAVVAEYVNAATLAVQAGFDGIELHAANGYLLEQFLNANVNTRTDGYGGSAAKRNRFVLEVAEGCVKAIGGDKVGIRVSPHGIFNATGPFEGVDEQFAELAQKLSDLGLVYLHQLDHSAMGTPAIPAASKQQLRKTFKQSYIAAGGFDATSAQALLASGDADLIAFGRPFLTTPDLVARMKKGAAPNEPDVSTFYTPGEKGYTDYAVMA